MQRASSINIMESMGIRVFADEARTQFVSILDLFEQISQKWRDPTVSAALKTQFEQAANEAGLFNEELAVAVGLQEEYNDLQKRDLAQSAAGVRRRNYFISLMERFSQVQEVVNNMLDAEGYSLRENERTMEGLEKRYTSLKAAVQELAVALGDAGLLDILKGLTEGATNAAEGLANMDEKGRALLLTAVELLAAFTTLKAITGLFTTKSIAQLISGAHIIDKWLIGITAVTAAIGIFAYNYSKATSQSIEDTMKLVDAQEAEHKQVDNLIKKYEELENKADQTAEVKDEMLSIQKQLAMLLPDYVDYIDQEGNKYATNIPLIRQMNALKEKELDLKRKEMLMEAQTELPRLEAEQKRLEHQIQRNRERLASGDTVVQMRRGGRVYRIDETADLIKETEELALQLQRSQLTEAMYQSVIDELNRRYYYDPHVPIGWQTPAGWKDPSGGTTGGTGTGGGTGGGAGGAAGANEALRNALRLLEHKKRMDQLSLEEERNYLREIERLHARSAEERMDIAERIYNVEKAIRQKALDDYKGILDEQKRAFKEAYQEQLDLIDEKAEAEIAAQEAIIKGIEEELELLERKEDKHDYMTKMAELEEELAYWSVRTSEQARQKVVEINKKIDELEHDREVELQKQKLQDKKRAAEEEIDAIEKAAEEERKKWEKSYNMVEKAFDDHSTNIIAMAATMSREAYNQWVQNYLVPLQAALRSGTPEDVEGIVGGMEQSNRRSQVYQAAKAIVDLKRRWTAGDHSAAQDATYYYNKLGQLGAQDVANYLHQMTLEQAQNYLKTLPKLHGGGETLTYGMAYVKPGELWFPPDLSKDLRTLIAVASGITGRTGGDTYQTDRRVVIQGPLFNSEKTYFEDEIDGEILAREFQRVLLSMQ
jgi:hypothetical protein